MLVIACRRCRHTLYEGNELVMPLDVARQNGYTCPRCGSWLRARPTEIAIKTGQNDRGSVFWIAALSIDAPIPRGWGGLN